MDEILHIVCHSCCGTLETVSVDTDSSMGGNNVNSSGRSTPETASTDNPSGCNTREPAFVNRPEKRLTHLARRLRIIDVTTECFHQLAFSWAKVMLLGSLVSDLPLIDFWFVSGIVFLKGTIIFSRIRMFRQQSEHTLLANTSLRHIQYDCSIVSNLVSFFMRADFLKSPRIVPYHMWKLDGGTPLLKSKPTVLSNDDPLLSYSGWKIVKNPNFWFYCLQFFVVFACAALSLMRLVQHDFVYQASINNITGIIVLYSFVIVEAFVFFLEIGYWIWGTKVQKLFTQVAKEYDFGPMTICILRHFFDDAYSKCSEGRNLEVSNMNLFSFVEELLDSNSCKEQQVIGAMILKKLVQQETQFTDDTLHKIGNSKPVLKRLIEMLKWEDPEEKNIRGLASEIMFKLVSNENHASSIVEIQEAMESITSLLHSSGGSTDGRPHDVSPTEVEAYDFSTFNQLGLQILEHLARDHENCLKIRNAPGLFSHIVVLTSASQALQCELVPESLPQIKTVRLALQVVKTLACATERTGETLRRDILDNEDLLRNIRDLLQNRKSHLELQMLGLEILLSLGKNCEAREKIENINGMLMVIFGVFSQPIRTEEVGTTCNKAGEVLVMLIHERTNTCKKMLQAKKFVVKKLVDAFDNEILRLNAACILRDICAYFTPTEYGRLRIVVKVMPMVLKTIMEEEGRLLEVSIELASQILTFKDLQNENEIEMDRINANDFVQKLVEILRTYENPDVPGMRISVIKLVIVMMKFEHKYIALFRDLGIEQVLTRIAKRAVEFERCKIFSGRKWGWFEVNISNSIEAALSVLSEEPKETERKRKGTNIKIKRTEEKRGVRDSRHWKGEMENIKDPIISSMWNKNRSFNINVVDGLTCRSLD